METEVRIGQAVADSKQEMAIEAPVEQTAEHCSWDLTVAKIKLGNREGPGEITIGSAYPPYDSTNLPPSEAIENLICNAKRKNEHLVLGANANSYHMAWGSTNCNARDWKVLEEPSLADHQHIQFAIYARLCGSEMYRDPKRTNWDRYREVLGKAVQKIPTNMRGQKELDEAVELLEESIIDLFHENYPLKEKKNTKKVIPSENSDRVLVFFKICPDVITQENIHRNIFVSSMVDSPLSALYHALERVYAPALLKDDKWSQECDPKLQDLIVQLESGLRSMLHKTDPLSYQNVKRNENVLVIMSPEDEVSYWSTMANSTTRRDQRERSTAFYNALEPLGKDFSTLDSIALPDVDDVIETAHNSLDDLWKLEDFPYPQARMDHLLMVTGNTLARYVQNKLKSLKLWEEPYNQIEESLNQGIAACEKWAVICERLTSLFWPNYSPHPWDGEPFSPKYVKDFISRLREILHLRTLHRQLTRLLSPSEQEELQTKDTFKPFIGLNPIQYNPYTEPLWRTAIKQFESSIRPTEERVALKLKTQLRMNTNTLQLLQEFKRYQELIHRPSVKSTLVAERENLLGSLMEYISSANQEFGSGGESNRTRLMNMPEVISNIYWVRQLECKVRDIEKTSATILEDLTGYQELQRTVGEMLRDLKEYHSDQFDSWTRDVGAAIHNKTLSLRSDEPVVRFEQGKLMRVNYNPRLVGLIREVRQLLVLGYKVPARIQEAADHAKRFMRQAKALEQVANFHNTIGDRMIPSQRPMMLEAALELARLVQEQNGVTWSDTVAVDHYIGRLQTTVERLSRENNKLAAYHVQVREKVITLMDTDLLRHQQQWKDGLKAIRDIMAQVEAQKFSNMKSWRAHWDRQLYKVLEHQYQVGLEALNEHLPEIKVELIYRQQKLQFRPPMEEIRMKYYGQLKRFLAIPNNFRGVGEAGDGLIFPVIIDRNARRFSHLFAKAEELFARLEKIKDRWLQWVVLGSVNLDQLAEEYLQTADDWDRNFRTSKTLGQDIAKLPSMEEKVDCFSVSFLPVRAEIELHNRRYWDTLVSSLQSSIVRDVSTINKFTTESMEVLSQQPQTVEEIGDANKRHAEIMNSAPQMRQMFEEAERKNKTLASWTKERVEQMTQLASVWDNFQTMLDNHQYIISKQVEGIKSNLMIQVDNLSSETEKFRLRWEQSKPRETSLQDGGAEVLHRSLEVLREKRFEWETLLETRSKLEQDCTHFGMDPPEFAIFDEIEADLKRHEDMWSLFDEFNSGLQSLAEEEWVIFRSKSYRFEEFILSWQEKLKSSKETTSLTVRLLQELDKYKLIVPCIKYLRGEMFSDKQWMELFGILNMPSKTVEHLVFEDFLAVKENIAANTAALQDLNARAASEIVIRQALGELDIWEVEAKFVLTEHVDSRKEKVMLIKDFKDILNKIGDNQCLLQSIKNSPNYESFSDRASIWETRLADLDVFLHNLNQIQRKWVYLEPIFGAGTLSQDRARFHRVDQDFRYIMGSVAKDNKVVSLCRISNLHQILNTLLDQLSRCQKSLNDFLEEKRSVFPRFYFLGDDDLLEILGQSTKERVIQAHLKKLFAGIHSVVFDSGSQHITAMKSLEGEVVQLKKPVKLTQQVEEWLSALAKEMQNTLTHLLGECLNDAHRSQGGADPLKYPSQILCLAEQISFTKRCEDAITAHSLQDLLALLKAQMDTYTKLELEWAGGETEGDSQELELKLKALLLDTIHHISIVEQLIATQVSSVDEWHWQKQLRFYTRKDGKAVARMVDAEFSYTYEYQGNAPKLVHTPLTDKCYLTLTQGMHMGLGGNPYGPAGTGKTESVKALGGLLGRQVLVFNCDEGIDVQSMARIFVGLVKCGAWGCFDEFNRLEEATLSAISMQIQPIQMALKNGLKSVHLLDDEVPLDPNAGIFVTLNPAGKGYGGRQKLPDNLKQLFRPVVMSRPDNELIAEVILYCEGFRHAKSIGHKLVEVFDLSKKLLSTQTHYDWGLRALKTVLSGCGSVLKTSRKTSGLGALDEAGEMELVVQALRLNTLSKLTFADSSRFDSLVKDIFPGVTFTSGGYEKLTSALQDSCNELGLLPNKNQIRKCVELYEQLQQRMGVVIVGPSGSGKTTLCLLLKTALAKLGQAVKQHTINPKAIPRTQLLGQIDLDTRQWTDGVLTLSAQQVHSEPPEVHSWILCDGDVDPEWIESLNSVLDDNRLLTLPSGWRIQFGPNVNFLFETHDLSYASPATVSRMGMIFLSDEDIDLKDLVSAWIKNQPENNVNFVTQLIEDHFYRAVQWVISQGELVIPTSLVGVVQNGLSQLYNVTSRSHFTVALIRGLGGNLTPASREAFIKQVFDWTGEYVPDVNRLAYCFYNAQRDCLDTYTTDGSQSWEDLNSSGDTLPLILTADVKRTLDVVEPWLQPTTRQHFMLVGPPGCGKSLLLSYCFAKLRATEVATIHCSAQINPQHVLQKLSQVCMVISSNTGRVYRPRNSERLILYFKDLNLARPDKWGTSMLVAFLQQVITYNGFYDNNLEWVGLDGVQIVVSMVAGNAMGRHSLSTRFTSITRIYSVSYPERDQLKAIYGLYLTHVLHLCVPEHPVWHNSSKVASLASTMIKMYEEIKSTFTPVQQNHYLFTPRDLTRWCLGLFRYEIGSQDKGTDCILEVVIYEAMRLFRDKLVGHDDRNKFDTILKQILDSDWSKDSVMDKASGTFFVTAGSMNPVSSGAPVPALGKPLGKLETDDWISTIERGIQLFGREGQALDLLIFPEVLSTVAFVDRVLSVPRGSLLLAGRAGVGRKSAVRVVSALHGARLMSLKMGKGYSVKNFKTDLKNMMQIAGVEGEQVYLLLEDHQMEDTAFFDMINSLLSSGEVPGLYNVEEMEPIISPLKDIAAQEGFVGSAASFFADRVQKNLHVVLAMDFTNKNFTATCESNPALYKQCCVVWLDGWGTKSMRRVPQLLLARIEESADGTSKRPLSGRHRSAADEVLINGFLNIHENVPRELATPRRYIAFIHLYQHIYISKQSGILERRGRLQAGVAKLTEAREIVAKLKCEAAQQEEQLAEKQGKANAALQMITETMRSANTHKVEMESLKEQTEKENIQLIKRKKEIDEELSEIEPLIQEASAAVGNIKSESLSEIRSLRAPPDVIRDILEGVLRLMGILDTSWNSMKTFLAKRGVKEEIRSFDAHNITPESRQSVEKLLVDRKESFDPKNARRASVAAAPLASWVTANVKYSRVLEKIRPLEKEQSKLHRNLQMAEDQIGKLSEGLVDVDKAVADLKNQLNTYTKEAAAIEIHLNKAQDTINAAEGLVGKLNDEYERWKDQLKELSQDLEQLPLNTLLAAAFLTYLSNSPEDIRTSLMTKWQEMLKVEDFSLIRFLGSEKQQMQWLSEGLPSDQLSIQNALIIMQLAWLEPGTCLRPFLIDPSSLASEWLKKHLQDKPMDVVSQHSDRFTTSLELAIRFGKVLIIQEVDSIDPALYPVLRGDFINQGPRKVVQVGEKLIDYNDGFQLFLTSRNPEPDISPDSAAILTCINFTTTWAGLTGQLLACAVRQEKPELEERRRSLLRQEEELKFKLDQLQEVLLQELASAQGDILQNKELLASLNQTKVSSAAIYESLAESSRLQSELAAECDVYRPLAEFGGSLYFALTDLGKVNNMYRYSVAAFIRLFQKSLSSSTIQSGESPAEKIKGHQKRLQALVYQYTSWSVFKADRLMLALHIVRKMYPGLIKDNEWAVFTGQALSDARMDMEKASDVQPSWLSEDRAYELFLLKSTLPDLYRELHLQDTAMWSAFAHSGECENSFPVQLERHLTAFQRVLVVQALRPDRLLSVLMQFALHSLGLQDLSPTALNLKKLSEEALPSEPILLVISPGADPSEELRSLAVATVGAQHYHEVAMGQGQVSVALERLSTAAQQGEWLCLKNLHLMTYWLPTLEKELKGLQPHDNFRLWFTAEAHPRFSPILAQSCLKITYEAPQGVKKNLQRTYTSWGPEFLQGRGDDGVLRAKALFVLAWFHAVVQERRTFIPQGWAKFYEFSDADLRAGAEVLQQLFQKDSGDIKWEFVHGLCENAIYGGRVDNVQDIRVLASYLREFFNSSVLNFGRKPLGPGINIPPTSNYRDYITIIHQLSDKDMPSYFGLPANVERSWQRITSQEVISQLKTLLRPLEGTRKFDREEWQTQLTPILNLWKKLNQGSSLIQMKLPGSSEGPGEGASKGPLPVAIFLSIEYHNAVKLVQHVHKTLVSLSKVIRGTALPSGDTLNLAEAIMSHQTPSSWQKIWEGPEDPMLYLRSIMGRSLAVQRWNQQGSQVLRDAVDLSELFHPDTFLSALKQQTARDYGVPMDVLYLACSWGKSGLRGARLPVTITALQLEGAIFDGTRLAPSAADSPSITVAPPCNVAWMPKGSPTVYQEHEVISLPLYYTAERERVVVSLDVPCSGDHDKWLQTGAAFFLRN
ncbi:cytoplasmic dynein 2 heavy chain 1 [Anabrus simplex]|uniref:cytoplasmic dynein 2 heavy chain 1 n=1 Tax=Anabrus simplex TaxID=316456 RepID=UPI0035A2D02A